MTDTPASPTSSGVDATLRALLADILGLGEARAAALTEDSGLFGALPEFDSMAVATVRIFGSKIISSGGKPTSSTRIL